MIKKLLPLVLLILFFIDLGAETQVSVSTSRLIGTVGDRIKISSKVVTNIDIDGIDVDFGKGEFELISRDSKEPLLQGDNKVYEIVDEIIFFKTGDFKVGPGKVNLKKGEEVVEVKETNSLSIKIKTTLTDKDKDIKPIVGPAEIEGNPRHLIIYFIWVLIAALLILIVIYLFKRRKSKGVNEAEVILPPLEELKEGLRGLNQKKLIEKGKVKEYHLSFTAIVKRFLYRFYGFNAEDFTTSEIMEALEKCEDSNSLLKDFRVILDYSDLIKFAKMVPAKEQTESFYGNIEGLLVAFQAIDNRRKSEVKDVSAG